jgi:hypothetical protein
MPKLFKGLDANFQCRGFQFEVGKTYETPNAELCTTGFHACENPIDVLTYYPPCTSRYAEVELDGISDQRKQDSKRVGTKITIVRELSIREYIDVCGKWFASQKLEKQASGNSGHAQASGNSGHAQASGNSGHAQASGYSGHAQASGYSGHAQASGNYGHAQASGNSSVAVSLGIKGTATASGNCKFIVLGDWRDGELVDVKVGQSPFDLEDG